MNLRSNLTAGLFCVLVVILLSGIVKGCQATQTFLENREVLSRFSEKQHEFDSRLFDRKEVVSKLREVSPITIGVEEARSNTYFYDLDGKGKLMLYSFSDRYKEVARDKIFSFSIIANSKFLSSEQGISLTYTLLKLFNQDYNIEDIRKASLNFHDKVNGFNCVYGNEKLTDLTYERKCGYKTKIDSTSVDYIVLKEDLVKLANEVWKIKNDN